VSGAINGCEQETRLEVPSRVLVRLGILALPSSHNGKWPSSLKTAVGFPPMQKGASFNLEAVKAQKRWNPTIGK